MTLSTFQKLTATAALAASIGLAALGGANAQSAPNFRSGMVPTAAQWNSYFAAKQDVLGYTPCNSAGCTMTGRLNAFGSTAAQAGFNIGVGVAPTSPLNGDMWATFSGIYVYLNGAVIGPLTEGASGSFAATAPLTVSFSGGVVNYGIAGELLAANNLSDVASAVTARSNLGAAKSGANSDIASLTGLTTPLSVSQGGTGVNTSTGGGSTVLSNSPALTGAPTAPTQTASDNSTKIATDAFVQTAVSGAVAGGVPTPQGRLTLASGVPVMGKTTFSAQGTVYYTPYVGQSEALWNGTGYVPTACAEISNVLANSATGNAGPAAAAASSLYDLFIWNNGGACTLTRGPAWTNSTTRSLALTRQNGLLVNAAAITNGPGIGAGVYVGTIGTDSSGGTVSWFVGGVASGGSAATLNVWNEYNRVLVSANVTDSGATYTYATNTWRQARASSGNQISFVLGAAEDAITVAYGASAAGSGTLGSTNIASVGLNSTTAAAAFGFSLVAQTTNTSLSLSGAASYVMSPPAGSGFVAALEFGTSPSNTLDSSATNTLSALLRM